MNSIAETLARKVVFVVQSLVSCQLILFLVLFFNLWPANDAFICCDKEKKPWVLVEGEGHVG